MGKIIKNGIEYGGGGGGSGTGGHTIVDTDGSPVADEPKLQFTGLDVQDNSTDSETEVSAFGLNADSVDDIIDSANIPANPMATNGLVYSTTEQVVGKWIDGRPIYQKTVALEVPANSSGGTSSASVPGLDIAVSVEGVYLANDGGNHWMPCSHYNNMFTSSANTCVCWATSAKVLLRNFSSQAVARSTAYVTVRYTKAS
jgi:hypothetical protein